MQELSLNEVALVSGAGRATGTGSRLSQSCSDGLFYGVIGGGISGASGGLLGIALGMVGGFVGGGGSGGCFQAPKMLR